MYCCIYGCNIVEYNVDNHWHRLYIHILSSSFIFFLLLSNTEVNNWQHWCQTKLLFIGYRLSSHFANTFSDNSPSLSPPYLIQHYFIMLYRNTISVVIYGCKMGCMLSLTTSAKCFIRYLIFLLFMTRFMCNDYMSHCFGQLHLRHCYLIYGRVKIIVI